MKRYYNQDLIENTDSEPKRYCIELTQTLPGQANRMTSPQNQLKFWTSPDVQSCSTNLLVKRHADRNCDTIFLKRLNSQNSGASVFQFPTNLIPSFLDRVEDLLARLKAEEKNRFSLEGITEVSSPEDFVKDSFWEHKETIRLMRFVLRPYLSDWGISIRLWQEVDQEYYKEFEDSKGNFRTWKGPCTSINCKNLRQLVPILKYIHKTIPPADD